MALPTVSTVNWADFIINLGDTTEFITKFEAYLAARNTTNGEQDILLQAMVDWASTPEDTLIPAVSGGNEIDDYSVEHWFAKTLAEKVIASAAAASAEAWAITPEDTLVPASAGGNEVDEYSALHHRIKAALANGIDDAAIGLLTTYSSTKIEAGLTELKAAADSQLANIAVNAFNIAVASGLSVENMVDGVIDAFTDQTGIDTGRSINETYDGTGAFINYPTPQTVEYPPAQSATYVKATSEYDGTYVADNATDPALSLTGAPANNEWWAPETSNGENQRFHIDYGSATRITSFNYDNSHTSGGSTGTGVKNFTLWGSNTISAFNELTYATNTNWTQLSTSSSQFAQHAASDVADTKSFDVLTPGSYRYYAFKFADNWGVVTTMGLRHIEGFVGVADNNFALHTQASTALVSPDEAFTVAHQEDVSAVTLNTDLTAWVTRTALSTYTTLAATDNKLRLTAHGFTDGDRVIVSTATGDNFPTGLDGLTAYYVVNATTDDFEVSLTSGGAAVAITADNGAAQSVTDYSQATLAEVASLSAGRILTGTADLTSQAAGTDISTVLLTDNLKEMKIQALSTQWA